MVLEHAVAGKIFTDFQSVKQTTHFSDLCFQLERYYLLDKERSVDTWTVSRGGLLFRVDCLQRVLYIALQHVTVGQ